MIGGIPLLVLTICNTIYGTIDIPLIRALAGAEEVGIYALAYRWVGIPIFITTAVVTVFFPQFSAAAHGPDFAERVNRSVKLVAWVSVPAALGLAVLSDEIIGLLYDPEYAGAAILMTVLAFHIPLAGIDTVLASALIASDRTNRYLVVAATAAVLNPLACVVLIPITDERYGRGALGAAIAAVVTELVVMLGAFRLRSPGVVDAPTAWNLARTVAAGGVMSLAVLATQGLPIVVPVVVGVVTYAAAAMALKVVSAAELRTLGRQLIASRRPQVTPVESDEHQDETTRRGGTTA
jgi:O-antigen/teichoic acid export membrane protein